MTKKDLLENIDDYSPNEIVSAIQQGIVSFYELKTGTHGQFSPLKQRTVQKMLESGEIPTPLSESPKPEEPVVQQEVITTNTVSDTEPVQHVEPQTVISTPETTVTQETKSTSPTEPTIGTTPLYFGPSQQTTVQQPVEEQEQPITEPIEVEISQEETSYCPDCGCPLSPNILECPECGRPLNEESVPPYQEVINPFSQPVNTPSGEPSNLKKFNWGAMLLGWIWGLGNGVYWSLVILAIQVISNSLSATNHSLSLEAKRIFFSAIPNLIILAIQVFLGINGNKLAWQSGRFNNAEEFVVIQRKWTKGALIFWGIFLLLVIAITIIAYLG